MSPDRWLPLREVTSDTSSMRALARVVGQTLVFDAITLPAEGTRVGIELEGDVLASFPEIPEHDDAELDEPCLWAEGSAVGMTLSLDRPLPEGSTVVVVPVEAELPPPSRPPPPDSDDTLLVDSVAVEDLDDETAGDRVKGTVRGRSVVIDDWALLPAEGTVREVTLVALGVGAFADEWLAELSPEEQAELDDAVAEADTEEGIPAEVVFALLEEESDQLRGVVRDGVVQLKAPLPGVDRAYAVVLASVSR